MQDYFLSKFSSNFYYNRATVDTKWKKASRAVAYEPIPDRTLVAFVTDEAYRSAYFKSEKSETGDRESNNLNIPFVGGQWHHVCMAFEAAKGTLDIVLDGQILERADFGDGIDSVIRTDFYIMLRPLISEYTDVNMWDAKLDQSQMLDWTNCRRVSIGGCSDFNFICLTFELIISYHVQNHLLNIGTFRMETS